MYIGIYEVKIEEDITVNMPCRLFEEIMERNRDGMVTISFPKEEPGCLFQIYDLDRYEFFRGEKRNIQLSGRNMAIPEECRDEVTGETILVIGNLDKIEFWNIDEWESQEMQIDVDVLKEYRLDEKDEDIDMFDMLEDRLISLGYIRGYDILMANHADVYDRSSVEDVIAKTEKFYNRLKEAGGTGYCNYNDACLLEAVENQEEVFANIALLKEAGGDINDVLHTSPEIFFDKECTKEFIDEFHEIQTDAEIRENMARTNMMKLNLQTIPLSSLSDEEIMDIIELYKKEARENSEEVAELAGEIDDLRDDNKKLLEKLNVTFGKDEVGCSDPVDDIMLIDSDGSLICCIKLFEFYEDDIRYAVFAKNELDSRNRMVVYGGAFDDETNKPFKIESEVIWDKLSLILNAVWDIEYTYG